LAIISETLEDKSILALQGKTTTIEEQVTPLTHQVINEHGDTSIPTCNAAYRKSAFEEVGGFDAGFPFQNEDSDLSWRIREIGQVKFVPEMHVLHPPRTDTFKKNARKMQHLVSEFMLYHKNPTLYKKHRAISPWITIYWMVMVKAQGYHFIRRIKYIGQPRLMMKGLLLSIVWWIQLIRLLPVFWAKNLRYKSLFGQVF
jgi:GT2 family glycosyltransferase